MLPKALEGLLLELAKESTWTQSHSELLGIARDYAAQYGVTRDDWYDDPRAETFNDTDCQLRMADWPEGVFVWRSELHALLPWEGV